MAKAHVIWFSTQLSDGSDNPIEEISVFGQIKQSLRENKFKAIEPRIETDCSLFGGERLWHWFLDSVSDEEANYMVGVQGSENKSKQTIEWVVVIETQRTIFDWWYGRNKSGEARLKLLSSLFEELIRNDKTINSVRIDRNA